MYVEPGEPRIIHFWKPSCACGPKLGKGPSEADENPETGGPELAPAIGGDPEENPPVEWLAPGFRPGYPTELGIDLELTLCMPIPRDTDCCESSWEGRPPPDLELSDFRRNSLTFPGRKSAFSLAFPSHMSTRSQKSGSSSKAGLPPSSFRFPLRLVIPLILRRGPANRDMGQKPVMMARLFALSGCRHDRVLRMAGRHPILSTVELLLSPLESYSTFTRITTFDTFFTQLVLYVSFLRSYRVYPWLPGTLNQGPLELCTRLSQVDQDAIFFGS